MGFSSADALWVSNQHGALWENHVVTQWLRWRDWKEPSRWFWYWRDQRGNEVDLLLERNQRFIAIECKLSERQDKKAAKGIEKLKKFYGESEIDHAYIVCPTAIAFDIALGITTMPGWKTWET